MSKSFFLVLVMLIFSSVNCYWWNISDDPAPIPVTVEVITPVNENPSRVLHVIEQADVLIMESFPPQLSLVVKGYQPDGCMMPVIVEQTIEDTIVTVSIYRELPADAVCTMNIVYYEETIPLGSFEIGKTYTIIVNGYEVEVEL